MKTHAAVLENFPFIFSRLGNDFLDPSNDTVFKHDFDAVWMVRRVGKDFSNDPFGQFSRALIRLLHNSHSHTGVDLRSSLTIHYLIMPSFDSGRNV